MDSHLTSYFKIIFLLLFSQLATAKVAYLPLIEEVDRDLISNKLGVFDLDLGTEVARITIGDDGGGAVFLNNDESTLYAGADHRIVAINTTTLEIEKTWDNLPVKVSEIFLSEDNQILYFIMLEPGPNELKLFQINLSTDEVSEVFDQADDEFVVVKQSPNLKYMTVSLYNNTTGEHRIRTYQTNDLNQLHDIEPASGEYVALVDNSGENYYYYKASNLDGLTSISLIDGTENWSFADPDEPHFFAAHELNDQYMIQFGYENNYLIDKKTGQGIAFASDNNDAPDYIRWGFNLIDQRQMILVEVPDTWCEYNICGIASQLSIRQVDLFNNNSQQLYLSDSRVGSLPFGRFIGERRYVRGNAQAVPFANQGVLLLLTSIMILVVYRHKAGYAKSNQ